MVEHVYHHTAMQIYYWIMLIREETRILILKFAHVIVGYSGEKSFFSAEFDSFDIFKVFFLSSKFYAFVSPYSGIRLIHSQIPVNAGDLLERFLYSSVKRRLIFPRKGKFAFEN